MNEMKVFLFCVLSGINPLTLLAIVRDLMYSQDSPDMALRVLDALIPAIAPEMNDPTVRRLACENVLAAVMQILLEQMIEDLTNKYKQN